MVKEHSVIISTKFDSAVVERVESGPSLVYYNITMPNGDGDGAQFPSQVLYMLLSRAEGNSKFRVSSSLVSKLWDDAMRYAAKRNN